MHLGARYGRLVVRAAAGKTAARKLRWLCTCDCGKETVTVGSRLRSGHTKSCGCLSVELAAERGRCMAGSGAQLRAVTHHGGAHTYTYQSWAGMRARCLRPVTNRYENYGGRGITICDRWNDFANFLTDMSVRPSGKTLHRIDHHGHYEPSNCRWATPKEQAANKRASI